MAKNKAKLPNVIPGTPGPASVPPKYKVYKEVKKNILKALKVKDEQNAINRYKWSNLPMTISSQDLERFLYIKGQLCFFKLDGIEEYYVMPFALSGGIDFYGRFRTIHPIPMAEGVGDRNDSNLTMQRNFLSTLNLKVIHDESQINEEVDIENSTVLLYDYPKFISENIIPRYRLQETILDVMSDCVPYMRTALKNSTGIEGMRINAQDEASNVLAANGSIDDAAQEGWKFVPIVGNLADFQELTGSSPAKGEEFMQAMQSLDNLRLGFYGLDNGGVFEKKAHMLGSEQEMNEQQGNDILQDGLDIRKRFCDIANKLFGLNIQVEINPEAKPQKSEQEAMNEDTGDEGGSENGSMD